MTLTVVLLGVDGETVGDGVAMNALRIFSAWRG